MAGSGPLLHDIDSLEDVTITQNDTRPHRNELLMITKARIAPAIKALRVTALALSVVILGLLVTNLIILNGGYFNYNWNTTHLTEVYLKWMILIILLSVINAIIRVPGLLNIIPDAAFTTGVIITLVRMIPELPGYQWCEERRWPKPEPPHPHCVQKKMTVTIIMGLVVGLGIALAATYVALLCLRALVIFNSRFWERNCWNIPAGGVSWSISLNVIRNENETSIGISAGSKKLAPEGQGQVHL